MLPVPVSGDDMVQGELPSFLATVLAGIPVTFEDLETGEFSP